VNRRTWLKANSLAVVSALTGSRGLLSHAGAAESEASTEVHSEKFRHRGYLGWITDLASEPDPHAAWPSMRFDEQLFEDYKKTFKVMRELGFNEISIWGLYVSRAWPPDIRSCVSSERGAMVMKLIEAAHEQGIRVLSGLGVYSWGFEEIIRRDPKVSRGSSQAMCASEPAAWGWMQRVLDFVFDRFPIDGVSMQSADQGRCRCTECKAHTDAEYHCLLNVRVSEYIRSRWPKKTVGVNSWGTRFNDADSLAALVKMSQKVDYLIDVHDTSRWGGRQYRQRLIRSLACDFGTLGGPQVEPPQHWKRDRWLLPVLRRAGEHLKQLYDDGGRACEYFFHITANPGDEVSLWLAAKILSNPRSAWQKLLQEVVEELFRIRKVATRDNLIELLLRSEEAYFKYRSKDECGTISLEPLIGDRSGPPIYLTADLNEEQRAEYERELKNIRSTAESLLADVPDRKKMETILRCLGNVLSDLAEIRQRRESAAEARGGSLMDDERSD
jgi:hypothetical protein